MKIKPYKTKVCERCSEEYRIILFGNSNTVCIYCARNDKKILESDKNILQTKASKLLSEPEIRETINQIKIKIGCQNKLCKWRGDFIPQQLEFHHLYDKLFAISACRSVKKITSQMISDEIKKCICICSNCHRLIHLFPDLIEFDIDPIIVEPENFEQSHYKFKEPMKLNHSIFSDTDI